MLEGTPSSPLTSTPHTSTPEKKVRRTKRPKPEHPPVMRTDLLDSNLSKEKRDKVLAVLFAYRRGAVGIAQEQWRLFFETGRFQKHHDVDKVTHRNTIGAANRVQMCRHQVVGILKSWVSNRANDFRRTVAGSSLDVHIKHQLFVINRLKAWHTPEPVFMPAKPVEEMTSVIDTDIDTSASGESRSGSSLEAVPDGAKAPAENTPPVFVPGEEIGPEVRRLARRIFKAVCKGHRRPNLSRISMVLDHRAATWSKPTVALQNGQVLYWVRLSTMETGQTIQVPLLTNPFHAARMGKRSLGVQVNLSREGTLTFGIVTDIGSVCAQSRKDFERLRARRDREGEGVDAIGLDFGLSTLFGTSEGQLLGQGFLKRLTVYDQRLTHIAQGVQKRGGKPRDNRRYRDTVTAIRGFIRTEVNSIFNRLVMHRMPRHLVLERLRFSHPNLSHRLNRILSNCGRSVIQTKLRDLKDRFGVTHTEVNPAHTSQECHSCGYIDKRNRRAQKTFSCLWCGLTRHADLNASRVVNGRRASVSGHVWLSKANVLARGVRAFGERAVRRFGTVPWTGVDRPGTLRTWVRAEDPRDTNPYFRRKPDDGPEALKLVDKAETPALSCQ